MTGSHGRPDRRPGLAFAALFALLYATQYLAYQAVPDRVLADVVYRHGIVGRAAAAIELLAPGEQAVADGHRLVSPRAALEIVRGCDGSGVLFLLLAAIVALRAGWRRSVTGAIGALLLVWTLNQCRVIGLYFVAAYRPDWFTPLHGFLVPSLFVIVAALYYGGWVARLPESTR
jgi:exosortase family protein XrtM